MIQATWHGHTRTDFKTLQAARSWIGRLNRLYREDPDAAERAAYSGKVPRKKKNPKKKKKARSKTKRISAALSGFLKRMNPSKMRGVTHVRVKKLKDGGLTITPVHGVTVRRRKR